MRKWFDKYFDKYIAQSSKGQMCALAMAFAILIIAGAIIGLYVLDKDNPNSAKFGNRCTWGLMQCVDGGFVDATITSNTKFPSSASEDEKDDEKKIIANAPVAVILLSLGFWMGGAILMSFFTGTAANFLAARREKILKGDVLYSFQKNYILIVGYDFQTKNLIRQLFNKENSASKLDIVLLTDLPVENIYGTLRSDLQPSELRRLFIMRKDITQDKSYEDFRIAAAEEIYLIGDGDLIGRDGKTLRALDTICRTAEREVVKQQKLIKQIHKDRQVKVYLNIEDFVLYSNLRAIELSMDKKPNMFDLDVYNYYESWAWECWSNKDSKDGFAPYLPIRHLEGTKHSELFVIGAGRMGRAMVNFAMPLMNYGGDGKHNRITVFDPDESKKGLLPDQKTLDMLPELEFVFRPIDGCSDESSEMILEAARKKDTSVTVVVAIPDPAAAIRAYLAFSKSLCRENISVLVWQETDSKSVPDKSYLRMGGNGSNADKRQLRYFGMTDRLPWKNPVRSNYGMAVNFYYSFWYSTPEKAAKAPNATDVDFIEKAKESWDAEKAKTEWISTYRWEKWSNVNCGDTFREKSVLFKGVPYAVAAESVLKAEHNRWWTERILGGWLHANWLPPGEKDKVNMFHGDMIPFKDLPKDERNKDKINIAAMAACGLLEETTSSRDC